MKIRMYRGDLAESLAEAVEIEPTPAAIAAHVNQRWSYRHVHIDPERIRVEPHGSVISLGWDTHVVLIDGYGVFGFTDGPIP